MGWVGEEEKRGVCSVCSCGRGARLDEPQDREVLLDSPHVDLRVATLGEAHCGAALAAVLVLEVVVVGLQVPLDVVVVTSALRGRARLPVGK